MICKLISLITLQFFIYSISSQSCYNNYSGDVLNDNYIQGNVFTKRVVPYTHLSERDVLWSKRIWRTIDLRERLNHPLFYPKEPMSDKASLWDIIKCAVLNEKSLTIYELGFELDDQFRYPVVPEKGNPNDVNFKKRLTSFFGEEQITDSLDENGEPVYDFETNKKITRIYLEEFTSSDIIGYDLKEDWFFDKQKSVMEVRIIGISPVVYFRNPISGDIMGKRNLFWLYFPECRYTFQNHKVYNPQNDALSMSFDDLFWKRQFSSYITKESNVANRSINMTKSGIDALFESESIKNSIFNIEHDMWHY